MWEACCVGCEKDLDFDVVVLDWDLLFDELDFLVDEEIDLILSEVEDLSYFEDEECLISGSLSLSLRCEDLDFFDFFDLDRECLSGLSSFLELFFLDFLDDFLDALRLQDSL